jgi:hypothetical protein
VIAWRYRELLQIVNSHARFVLFWKISPSVYVFFIAGDPSHNYVQINYY